MANTRVSVIALLAALPLSQVSAEITLDGTMGPAGPLSGPDFTISDALGSTEGTNLFHSFSVFSINSTESATFTGPAGLDNVISRVTGGTASSIDGLFRSTVPGANIYFINPSGILFGENASVDVPAAFHLSTASYLRHEDGGVFHASIPANTVLTAAPPSAFGFLDSLPGSIEIDRTELGVQVGETISMIAGDITITGDGLFEQPNLIAPSGRIDIASVASPGEVIPSASGEPPALQLASFEDLGRIEIPQGSISTKGDPGGSIFIRGGQLVMPGGVIDAGSEQGADSLAVGVDIAVATEMILEGGAAVQSSSFGAGRAGNISISTGMLQISGDPGTNEFASIGARVFGSGDGANIDVVADSVRLAGGGSLITQVFGSGAGGDLTIDTGVLEVSGEENRAFISTSTFASGDAGNLDIIAETVLLRGGNPLFTGLATQVSSEASVAANGGDLRLSAGELQILNGAQINAGIFSGAGNGGTIILTADTIVIDGASPVGVPAGVFSNTTGFTTTGNAGDIQISAGDLLVGNTGQIGAFSGSLGDSGNIDIVAKKLSVTGGSIVSTTNFGLGIAGNLNISADTVSLVGPSPAGTNTGLFTLAGVFSADAGDVRLKSGSLNILDGAEINSGTSGPGAGGIIDIAASSVLIRGEDEANGIPSRIEASTFVFANFVANATGPGGDILIVANDLDVRENGEINASSRSAGSGGSIEVFASNVTLSDAALITAEGTESGNAGNVLIQASDTFRSQGSDVSTQALASDGGNITFTVGTMVDLLDSTVTTSVQGGAGAGGNITIDPQFVIVQNSKIIANAFGGPGGNISIVAGLFLIDPSSVISASSAIGIDGTINVDSPVADVTSGVTELPSTVLDASSLVQAPCAARMRGETSSLTSAGRSGLPAGPDDYLPSLEFELTASANAASIPISARDSVDGASALQLAMTEFGCT